MTKENNLANQIAQEYMYANDAFSKWLGIDFIHVEKGSCMLKMKIRAEMLNGFGVAHGGIAYSFADSALAFASNSYGRHAVSIETSISHTIPILREDTIFAETIAINIGYKIAIYRIEITNQKGDLVADFKGTVYRSSKKWEKLKI